MNQRFGVSSATSSRRHGGTTPNEIPARARARDAEGARKSVAESKSADRAASGPTATQHPAEAARGETNQDRAPRRPKAARRNRSASPTGGSRVAVCAPNTRKSHVVDESAIRGLLSHLISPPRRDHAERVPRGPAGARCRE